MSYCNKCGASNAPDATQCVLCGVPLQAPQQPQQPPAPQTPYPPQQPQYPPQQPQHPPQSPYGQQGPYQPPPPPGMGTYGPARYTQPYQAPQPGPSMTGTIILSIFATVCCGCLPLGIYSLVLAIQANTQSAQGNIHGARELGDKSKTWAFVSIGIGVVLLILNIIRVVAEIGGSGLR